MTNEQIIQWAKDCLLLDFRDDPVRDTNIAAFVGTLKDFAELVAAATREECAALCDRFQARDVGMQPAECAAAIRAMSVNY
jgi:hypothetical protein